MDQLPSCSTTNALSPLADLEILKTYGAIRPDRSVLAMAVTSGLLRKACDDILGERCYRYGSLHSVYAQMHIVVSSCEQ